jgi:hypothetical protein
VSTFIRGARGHVQSDRANIKHTKVDELDENIDDFVASKPTLPVAGMVIGIKQGGGVQKW